MTRRLARAARALHRDDRGALAVEYLLIMALVVLPIGALLALFLRMIANYGGRVVDGIRLPFP